MIAEVSVQDVNNFGNVQRRTRQSPPVLAKADAFDEAGCELLRQPPDVERCQRKRFGAGVYTAGHNPIAPIAEVQSRT
jgi:hypothetical protein